MAVLGDAARDAARPDGTWAASEVPLVVGLDGVLLATHSTVESVGLFARRHPASLPALLGWRLQGRALFKARLAERAMPDIATLPYRPEIMSYLRSVRESGRRVVLATAANERLAWAVAEHTGLFDEVLASDATHECSGAYKRRWLVERFGERGFDYLGHDFEDLAVFESARAVLLVAPSRLLLERVRRVGHLERVFEARRGRVGDYLHALRVHHWSKNLLVFLPLLDRQRGWDPHALASGTLAFLAFSLCASSLYVANDLMDLPADRVNPLKRDRRLAAGRISSLHAALMAPAIFVASLALAATLSREFLATLLAYAGLVLIYSIRLKDVPLLEAVVLAGGYVLRAVAGSIAMRVPLSKLLAVFCGLLFFSLVLVKRFVALELGRPHPGLVQPAREPDGRNEPLVGYRAIDGATLRIEGIASGYLSVLVLLSEFEGKGWIQLTASGPPAGWVLCALLFYWVSYLWFMASRDRVHADPVVFALTDRRSLVLMLGMACAALFTV